LVLTPVSRRAFTKQDRYRLAGVGGAMLFLVLCVVLRASHGAPRVPPVESPVWAAVASVTPSANGEKQTQDKPDEKGVLQTATVAADLPDPELQSLQERLNRRPEDWPAVQTELERWLKAHSRILPVDQSRFEALSKALAVKLAAESDVDWQRRWSAAQAFARAAQFSTAQRILEEVPAHLLASLKTRFADASKSIKQDEVDWTKQSRERFEALQRMGHLRVSGAMLEAWNDLMKRDEAPENDPRRNALGEAVEAFRLAAALRQNQDQAEAAAREQVQRKLVEIRVASGRHEVPVAIALCEKALGAAAGEYETAVLKAERERLTRVQRLFQELADALSRNPRVITERVFRPNEATPGQIIGMDDRHLIVEVPNTGRSTSEAKLPLSSISRSEMRLLIEDVFRVRKLVSPDDPIGRLAYGLEDASTESRTSLYRELSAGEQPEQAWLKLVLLSERHERRRMAARQIDESEQLYVKSRFVEALRALASAREALGTELGVQDPKTKAGLGGRTMDLLERIAEAESRSRRLRGTCFMPLPPRARVDSTAAELTVWPWKPVEPRLGQGGLTFDTGAAATDPAWQLQGHARLEWELVLPDPIRGSFSLGLMSGERSWAVRLAKEEGRVVMSLESTVAAAAPWSATRVPLKSERARLWLETDSEQLRWGVDDRTLGTYMTELQGTWCVRLSGQGEVVVSGLRVEGAVEALAPLDDKAGEALLRAVLARPVGSRLRALRETLASPILNLTQRAVCYAGMADENETLGLSGEAHALNALALYACPWDQLPEEVRAREPGHRERQMQFEREGRMPVDLRKF
jgi:predicted DNA-binding protein (UPF0251 family)